MYDSKTWSLTLREESGQWELWGVYGPRKDDVTGGWRKPHNEKLHNLYMYKV
jgi:hypothetical protein